ncbi:bifunctional nuclease family protein [Agromyces larvae]|uniref:Bifunctional nuclease family protein n=1 Tax=Agromyces larvae TaxID=2929802 RepID=A0ABY4BY49_9MICO|nr:bifunctional nuclease family protein [Agromyces larvae]UOE44088.1 bifunctional nuclease family protein [Agromyces larvae]
MIQVRVLGIALDPARQHIVLLKPVLEEPGEGLVLPIWIGVQEATSILIAISDEHAPRPLSHDLMKTLLDTVGAEVDRVDVTRIDEGTFYAEISLDTAAGRRTVDARPSDAIALGVRAGAPIFVAEAVFEDAGIPAATAEGHDEAADEAKLDEFKRFLDEVDPEDFQG